MIKRYFDFVNEKAVPFVDILHGETQGIIVKDTDTGTIRSIALYDFDDKKVIAYAQVHRWNKTAKVWEITMMAAEKDYGPDIADLALMSVYPDSVKPSPNISPTSQKVWKFYKGKRKDVEKSDIREGDDLYSTKYETEVNGKWSDEPEMLGIVNTAYKLERSDVFDKLVDRGKEYVEKYHTDASKIIRDANTYFWKRYL